VNTFRNPDYVSYLLVSKVKRNVSFVWEDILVSIWSVIWFFATPTTTVACCQLVRYNWDRTNELFRLFPSWCCKCCVKWTCRYWIYAYIGLPVTRPTSYPAYTSNNTAAVHVKKISWKHLILGYRCFDVVNALYVWVSYAIVCRSCGWPVWVWRFDSILWEAGKCKEVSVKSLTALRNNLRLMSFV
jgi:hypothetical protein